jgi:hypothetical protein
VQGSRAAAVATAAPAGTLEATPAALSHLSAVSSWQNTLFAADEYA